jgi:fermentation-respiration switch protein FrsA (DUF1100 family)
MFDDLYKKIWGKIIKPEPISYSQHDLGPTTTFVDDNVVTRQDLVLKNIVGHQIHASVWWPKNRVSYSPDTSQDSPSFDLNCGTPDSKSAQNQEPSIPEDQSPLPDQENLETMPADPDTPDSEKIDCVIYCHSHNGCRLQGLYLKDYFLASNTAFCSFDYTAAGKSSGQYVTLGWYETFDIDCVVKHLLSTNKINRVALWGRSMGASSILFYTSLNFRCEMEKEISLTRTSDQKLYAPLSTISCVVLDSPFKDITKSIKLLVNVTNPYVPNFAIDWALNILGSSVKDRADIDLKKIRPGNYVDSISVPGYFLVSDNDEFVTQKGFQRMVDKFGGEKKKLVVEGTHASFRDEEHNWMLSDFILDSFKEGFVQKLQDSPGRLKRSVINA